MNCRADSIVQKRVFTRARAEANGGGPSWLQSPRPVAAVAELGSFGKGMSPQLPSLPKATITEVASVMKIAYEP